MVRTKEAKAMSRLGKIRSKLPAQAAPEWARPGLPASRPAKAPRASAVKWAAAGAAAGLAAGALASVPAQALAALIHSASAGRVELAEARGTVWSGSAIVELHGPAGRSVALEGRAAWSFGFGWSGPRLSASSPACAGGQPAAQASWSGSVAVGPFECRLPPEALGMAAGSWSAMSPRGAVKLSSKGLALARAPASIRGEGDVEVEGLCLSVSRACPLGSYRVHWAATGSEASFEVAPLGSGPLEIQGRGALGWGGAPGSSFSGTAKAAPGAGGEVDNLLALLGSRSGSQARIQWGAGG